VRGPDTGSKVVVFWDYVAPDAPILAAALADLRSIRAVRETAFHFPVADARPCAFLAAIVVEAARVQNRFWEAHDRLLKLSTHAPYALCSVETLVDDRDGFRADVARQIGRERVLEDICLATACGARRSPTVLIEGVRLDAVPDVRQLTWLIDALAKEPANAHPPSAFFDSRATSLDPWLDESDELAFRIVE
jgi:hypothetical protein